MKFNWGTGIVIGMALFMGFILTLVFMLQTNPKYDHHLVTKDYYIKEKHVQENIEKQQNANQLEEKVKFVKSENGIAIVFPASVNCNNIKGNLEFYRPSNENLDFNSELNLKNNQMLIPASKLEKGVWEVTLDWQLNDKKYLVKESIYF